jgi:hypothetical protein
LQPEISDLVDESDSFASQLQKLTDLPPGDDSKKLELAYTACSLAYEHWHAIRQLLSGGFLPSALVLHRTQFETIVRSIWLTYAATETNIAKLSADLNYESEQAAKSISQTQEMIEAIKKHGPVAAYDAVSRFKEYSWKALNSYTHSGIHPLNRHAQGYPVVLLQNVLRNVNGLGVLTGIQIAAIAGSPPMQREVLELAAKFPKLMPPHL